jgi:hypothetical protein
MYCYRRAILPVIGPIFLVFQTLGVYRELDWDFEMLMSSSV